MWYKKIVTQKQKYAIKTLSEDGSLISMFNISDIFDLVTFFAEWNLSDTLFSSLVSSLLFDIPMIDIVPSNLLWNIEFPTVEEFLRGLLIKFEPIKLDEILPEFEEAFKFNEKLIEQLYIDEYASRVKETRLVKGRYGVSRYGMSYYDPTPMYEFLRSTLLAVMKKKRMLDTARRDIYTIGKELGLDDNLIEDIFNRLVMITYAIQNCAFVDLAFVDVTTVCDEGSEGKLHFVNFNLEPDWRYVEFVDDIETCAWVNDALVEYSYVCADKYPHRIDPQTKMDILAKVQEQLITNFRRRTLNTFLAQMNYQTYEERKEPLKSWRTDYYGESRIFARRIEQTVERVVRSIKPDIPPIQLRQYKVASLKLFSALTGIHKWGYEEYRSLSKDELRNQWINEWTEKGLDRTILERLFDEVYATIRRIGTRRFLTRERRLKYIRG